jgi:carbon storage regulator
MLVLSRKVDERIQVGDDVTITIVRIGPAAVRIGIDAPPHMNILRSELADLQTADAAAAGTTAARR